MCDLPVRGGWDLAGQLAADPAAHDQKLGDAGVKVGELASEHLDRAGALRTGLVARAQAIDERPGLLQVEPDLEERPDLPDQPQIVLVVLAVAVGGAAGVQQPMLFVVPQRAGARPGAVGELTNAHAATVNLDADVKASRSWTRG